MRIAISGSHRTGKSTLLAELAQLLPTYTSVEEPYHLREEEGYELSHPPSVEDFEALERWLEALAEAGDDALFDRCPLDLMAYLDVYEGADGFDRQQWSARVRAAVEALDLIVFVPIEQPDRIVFSAADDDDGTRAAVDEQLRELLVEERDELGVRVIEVTGDPESRAQRVLRALRRRSG